MTGNDCSVLEQAIQFPPHLRLRFWAAWLRVRLGLCKERSMNEWIREILKNYQGSKLIQAFFRPLLLILSNIKGKVSIDEKTSTDIVVYACLHLASAWMQQQPIPMFAQQSVAGWGVGGGIWRSEIYLFAMRITGLLWFLPTSMLPGLLLPLECQQDHLRMNDSTGLNNYLRSIDCIR